MANSAQLSQFSPTPILMILAKAHFLGTLGRQSPLLNLTPPSAFPSMIPHFISVHETEGSLSYEL